MTNLSNRTKDVLLGGVGSDAKNLRDLVDRASLEMPQRKREALERAHSIHRFPDWTTAVRACGKTFGIGSQGRDGVGDVRDRLRVVEVRPTATGTQMIQRTVHEDAIEPGAKVGSFFELLKMQIRVEQTILHDILRILLIAGDAEGEVVQVSPMTLDERQEHLQIAVVHFTGSSLASTIEGWLNVPC
jgi:hypothetical protein